MKYIKRILLGIFCLLVLVTAAVFILINFYQKEMVGLLTDSLKTNYGLTLKVQRIDVSFISNWPQASVQLKNVYLASDVYAAKNEPLLKAGSISLSFNLEKLMHKQFIVTSVSIKDGDVLMIRNHDGSRNFEFKRSAAPAQPGVKEAISFDINKVTIKNTQFRFLNRAKQQNIALKFDDVAVRMKLAQDGLRAALKGNIAVRELLFNHNKGAFLKNSRLQADLDISAYFKSKMIVVHPTSQVTIEHQPLHVNAFVQLDSAKKLMLHIEGERLRYEQVGRLLTPKIQHVLGNFTMARPFDAKATIITRLDVKEDPVLMVDMDVKDNAVNIGNSKVPYNHLSFKARVLSLDSSRQRGNIEQATIAFKGIKGLLYDYPFTASVRIANLTDPSIDINARLAIEAQKIHYKVAQDFVLKGSCVARISYSGPTHKLNKDEFLSPAMRLNADLFFTNFSYQEKNKSFTYLVNGKANVNNNDLKFDKLLLKTAAGDAMLKGRATNFVSYVLGTSNNVKAELSATSDYLDLNPFLPQKNSASPPADKKTNSEYKQNVQQQSDESNFDFNVSIYARKLIIRKVQTEQTRIDLSYNKRLLTIKSIRANMCGGKVFAKATIYDLDKIKAEMEMEDIDITELFTEFENFGQKKVDSKNLKGRISMTATFKTDLNDNMEVLTETMGGEVKLKLKDGHLMNFEPVQSMSNFLFRNRDFNDVTFSELSENFKIQGYEMQIQELEIASNILNLYVSGIYNFQDKATSNINLLIPWQNLKKRGKNYVPKSSGQSAEDARGVKLNFSGPTNNMKLSFGHKEMGS